MASKCFLWMQQLAIPDIYVSSPLSLDPVIPKQSPMLFLSRARQQHEQTSVKKPNLAQGIANIVFSVAILKGAMQLIPYPPPITYPSQTAICWDLSWASKQSLENYSLMKVSLSSTVALFKNICLTSPPAQNALSPTPSNHTAFALLKLGIQFLSSRIMRRLRVLRDAGLLSTTFVNESNSCKSMCPSVFAEEKAPKASLTARPLAKILIIQNNPKQLISSSLYPQKIINWISFPSHWQSYLISQLFSHVHMTSSTFWQSSILFSNVSQVLPSRHTYGQSLSLNLNLEYSFCEIVYLPIISLSWLQLLRADWQLLFCFAKITLLSLFLLLLHVANNQIGKTCRMSGREPTIDFVESHDESHGLHMFLV